MFTHHSKKRGKGRPIGAMVKQNFSSFASFSLGSSWSINLIGSSFFLDSHYFAASFPRRAQDMYKRNPFTFELRINKLAVTDPVLEVNALLEM